MGCESIHFLIAMYIKKIVIIISSTHHVVVRIGLNQTTYMVTENEQLQICASLVTGQLERDIVVLVTFTPSTASSQDFNFNQASQTLLFSQQSTQLCYDVEIVDDELFEDSETFFVGLQTDESGGVVRFTISSASVIIISDDGEICCN